MSIKRYSGAAFAAVSSRKRFTGSGWVDLTIGKRWNGSAWVDLWNDSGGSGGNNSDSNNAPQNSSGVLFSDMKSTVSSPTVHYSASYEVSDSSLVLTFKAVWSGTAKHSASLLLNGTASGRTKIELYVTRSGSSYSGSAGSIGSAKKPKTYYFNA